MTKDWWFKFEFGKWRNDSSLRRCSLETKGFWIECLCAMREAGSSELVGTFAEIARLIGCFPEEVSKCVIELKRTGTADVTLGNDCVTLSSRYLDRELKAKQKTKLRVRKHRESSDGNADVTLQSKSKELEKEIKEEKKEEAKPSAPPPSNKVSGSRIPEPFPLTDEMQEWARTTYPALRLERAHENFIEHYTNDTTKKALKVDWLKTWKKGMGLAMDWQNEDAAKSRPTSAPTNRVTARQLQAANIAVMERDKAEADALMTAGH
jgi:hypothetical protein